MVSIWEKETFFAPQDVIIIGSGLTGLWSAFFLKKKNPGLNITVADRGVIPAGASTRNAGFACFGSLSELVQDAQTMGSDKMRHLVEMRYKGLERMQNMLSKKKIDFEKCGGYELYADYDHISTQQLKENIAVFNKELNPITGRGDTFKLIDEKIKNFGFGETRHLIKNRLEGYLHSGKLLQELLHMVRVLGVQVLTGTEIKGFENAGNSIRLTTRPSFHLTARLLLVCTNAFAKELLPQLDVLPARGQVLLTSPIPDLGWKGTFHADKGFYYFRNLGNRVLLGGARNKAFEAEQTVDMETTDFIQTELENYLSRVVLPHYKGRYNIEQRWSGIMAMGKDKMPIVRQIAAGIFCAVRMGGMGVALTPVVGEQAAEMMLPYL